MNEATPFQFELIAPDGMLDSRAITMVTLPGVVGEMGALRDHMPLMTVLQPGVIRLARNDLDEFDKVPVGEHPFCQVPGGACAVLQRAACPS